MADGEAFNITNTPGFAQPSGAFGTAPFGSITATVTVAKRKPTSFKPLRSAMVVPINVPFRAAHHGRHVFKMR